MQGIRKYLKEYMAHMVYTVRMGGLIRVAEHPGPSTCRCHICIFRLDPPGREHITQFIRFMGCFSI